MRSMIFSVLSGIALTLLMRGPAPTPAQQPCHVPAVAQQDPADAVTARVLDAVRDSLPAWLAGLDIGAAVAVASRDDAVWHEEYGVTAGPSFTRAARPPSDPPAPHATRESNSPPARRL
jgi:hypothetical protein